MELIGLLMLLLLLLNFYNYFNFYVESMCDRSHTPPCSTVVHIISRQSLIFDVILYFVQPSSLRYSSLPSPFPLYFHFHRPSSYVVLLSSQHMPIPPQPPFLDVICGFPHFRCPPYSFISILSSFITPHTHRSILISATSSLFSCALSNANVSAPYTSVGLTTAGPVHIPIDLHVHVLCHPTLHTLYSSYSTSSSLCGWLPHPVLHPPPKSIQCVWMSSLSLIYLHVNGSQRIDVHCTPSI